MYFALFDFEYTKLQFLRCPNFYKIGMMNACFSYSIFVQWLAYALFHGAIIYYGCYDQVVNLSQERKDGQKLELWAAGNLTYGGSIFVANLVLLHRFNIMDGYNVILLSLSVMAFFVCSFAENYIFKIPILYHVFFKLFTTKTIWLNLLFVTGTTSAIELLFRAIKKLFLEDGNL